MTKYTENEGPYEALTAKISAAPHLVYDSLLSRFGKATAQKTALANMNAVEKIADIVRERKIDCNFRRLPLYIYTESDEKADKIKRECRAAKELGLPVSYTEGVPLPFETGPLLCIIIRLSSTLGSTSWPLLKICLATAVTSLKKRVHSPSNPVL